MPSIDISQFITQSAVNRMARTAIGYAVGVGGAWLIAHNVPITASQEAEIVVIGGGLATTVIAYIWRKYIDQANIPLLNKLVPPQHPLVAVAQAETPVGGRSDAGDTDLPQAVRPSPMVPQSVFNMEKVPSADEPGDAPEQLGSDGRPVV